MNSALPVQHREAVLTNFYQTVGKTFPQLLVDDETGTTYMVCSVLPRTRLKPEQKDLLAKGNLFAYMASNAEGVNVAWLTLSQASWLKDHRKLSTCPGESADGQTIVAAAV